MLRRLVLVGLMVLYPRKILQLVLGTLLSAAFLLFQVQASPYAEKTDDPLASVCSFLLVIIFLCSTVFKYLELTSSKPSRKDEQRAAHLLRRRDERTH